MQKVCTSYLPKSYLCLPIANSMETNESDDDVKIIKELK